MKKYEPVIPVFDGKGHCQLNPRYKEILKLYDMLTDAHIPFTLRRNFDGWQILYPAVLQFPEEQDQVVCSVIQHYGSYGGPQDLLEIMGLLTPDEEDGNSVMGHLTAQEVFERIKQHWERQK
jgi:hypothetical protein